MTSTLVQCPGYSEEVINCVSQTQHNTLCADCNARLTRYINAQIKQICTYTYVQYDARVQLFFAEVYRRYYYMLMYVVDMNTFKTAIGTIPLSSGSVRGLTAKFAWELQYRGFGRVQYCIFNAIREHLLCTHWNIRDKIEQNNRGIYPCTIVDVYRCFNNNVYTCVMFSDMLPDGAYFIKRDVFDAGTINFVCQWLRNYNSHTAGNITNYVLYYLLPAIHDDSTTWQGNTHEHIQLLLIYLFKDVKPTSNLQDVVRQLITAADCWCNDIYDVTAQNINAATNISSDVVHAVLMPYMRRSKYHDFVRDVYTNYDDEMIDYYGNDMGACWIRYN